MKPFAKAVTLLLAFAPPSVASGSAWAGNLETLRQTPDYQRAVFESAQKTEAWINDGCAAAKARLADAVGSIVPPDVDVKGSPRSGAWLEHVLVEGCDRSRQLNVLVAVQGPGSVAMNPMLPGTTRADPTLQKDATAYAFTAAAIAVTGCPSMYVAETRYLDVLPDPPIVPGKPGWSERWTIAHCATKTDVTLRFVPDTTGTSVLAARSRP